MGRGGEATLQLHLSSHIAGFIDERKSTMVSTLDHNITELNDTLLGILAEMHSGSYVMPESEPAAVLEELHAIQATIEQHTNRAAAYRKYHERDEGGVDAHEERQEGEGDAHRHD